MKYKKLPKKITSPISGNTSDLMPKTWPNDVPFTVCNCYPEVKEIYDSPVVAYTVLDKEGWPGEIIYVPYED